MYILRKLFLPKPSVSFCITCRNRMWQITQTLPKNLKDNAKNKKKVEFILIDFGSTDGLGEWIKENFAEELESGYLKYFYTDGMKEWNMCIAKNTAHKFAKNDIVVNLDCDNFTGVKGGREVARVLNGYGCQKAFLHMWSGNGPDGTNGRLAVAREAFIKAGGYDEKLEPWGYDEDDLMDRLRAMGMRKRIFNDKKYSSAIMNEKGIGITIKEEGFGIVEMWKSNVKMSNDNVTAGRLVANGGGPIGVEAVRMFCNK